VTWGAAGAGTIVRLRRSPNGRVRPLCFIVRHLEDAPCSICREAPLSAARLCCGYMCFVGQSPPLPS
jgi:hypothetical protein